MGFGDRHEHRGKNLVGFIVADVHYAVDILRVREIIRPLPLVALPHAPPAVIGVADYRGEVLPTVDLRARFGLPAIERDDAVKWIVVKASERSVALVTDQVSEVFGADDPEERSVPEMGVGDAARGISAAYRHAGRLVFVLDIDRVAAPAEAMDMSLLHVPVDGST